MSALLAKTATVAVVCRRFGVSRQTAYKFLRRFRASGGEGLRNLAPGPVRPHAPQASRWGDLVIRLRRRYAGWGARKLQWLLRPAAIHERLPGERTVQRWLQQAGLIRPRRVRRRARTTSQRGTLPRRSNMVWTIDLKGWFLTGDGTKIEPLTIRDLWSRYVLWTRPVAPRNEASIRRVCQRLFRRYGRPRVIRCDRGAPFFGDGPHGFTRLSLWWWRQGIRVEFVRRGRINNNAHEQMHGVLKAELGIAHTAAAQARRLERWRLRYNEQRPHEAIGMRPPSEVYRPRPATRLKLIHPHYPGHYLQRRVQSNGEIQLPKWRGCIGRAFGGLTIGLAPAGRSRYRVYFAHLYLGSLDLNASRKLVLPDS